MPNDDDSTTSASTLASVAIKLPAFTTKNPILFFYSLEAQFEIKKIKDETTKFYYVVSGLPEHVLERIPDMLESRPSTDEYKEIKKRVLSIYQRPIGERLLECIDATSLGGLRPTAFADRISALTMGADLDAVHRAILLRALPPGPRAVLRPSTADFRDLAAEADKFFDISGGLIESAPSFVAASESGADNIATFRQQPSKAAPPRKDECFYHKKFGAAAKKCNAPCRWGASPTPEKGHRSGNDGAGGKW